MKLLRHKEFSLCIYLLDLLDSILGDDEACVIDDLVDVHLGSCGGCHAGSTGRLGMVRIISESSIAAGVRRIEAITGRRVEEMMDHLQDIMSNLRDLLGSAPDLTATVKKAIDDNAALKRPVDEFSAKHAQDVKQRFIQEARTIQGTTVVSGIDLIDAQNAKDIAFQLRAQYPQQLLVVIGGLADGKPSLTVSLSDDLVAQGKSAGQAIREAARLIQGGGGGQPHFATAGGKNPDGLKDAVEKVVELIL